MRKSVCVGLVFGLFSFLFSPLGAEYLPEARPLNKRSSENLILMTVPKSGTHLMAKLIYLMTGVKPVSCYSLFGAEQNIKFPQVDQRHFNNKVKRYFNRNTVVYDHFHFADLFRKYISNCDRIGRQASKVALLIRDPRDIFVSLTFYQYAEIQQAIVGCPSFDEMLLFVIQNSFAKNSSVFDIPWHINKLYEWIDQPNTAFFRFEELCGPNGGGSREAQFAAFRRLGRLLSIELTDRECIQMSKELFGKSKQKISHTFRSGKIGSWKEHFKEEHIAVFKQLYGEVLIKLGYEDDYDW